MLHVRLWWVGGYYEGDKEIRPMRVHIYGNDGKKIECEYGMWRYHPHQINLFQKKKSNKIPYIKINLFIRSSQAQCFLLLACCYTHTYFVTLLYIEMCGMVIFFFFQHLQEINFHSIGWLNSNFNSFNDPKTNRCVHIDPHSFPKIECTSPCIHIRYVTIKR